jgi:serine/threonine protein kinase
MSRPARRGSRFVPGYRVIGHLSRGNRLDVYDAWSSERECRVILKTLRPDRATEAPARRALIREGRLLGRFSHPHLVRAYEVIEASGGRPVVVLETLGGETLSHLIDRLDRSERRMPVRDAAILGLQLCSVVGYLHRHRLLHLDLKPGNVVAECGRARLIDLSIAGPPGVMSGGRGTFDYMAPEQATGGLVTEAADIWGIGAVLFDVLTGRPPFDDVATDGPSIPYPRASADRVDYPQLAGRAPAIATLRRLPSGLARIVDGCLEPGPGDRPPLPVLASALEGYAPTNSTPFGR